MEETTSGGLRTLGEQRADVRHKDKARRRWTRPVQLVGATLLVVSVPLTMLQTHATADTLTNTADNVTLTTEGTVTSDTPYSSGQVISVSVAANSTLAGDSSVEVWECSDLDGSSANLPTSAANNCDGNTTIKVTAINADGSVPAFNYTIYALPDSYLFGESSTSLPVCGSYPDECVLYIGASTGFAAGTYIFSAPFVVSSNSNDGGENPGDGEVPAVTSTSPTDSTVVSSPATNVADGASASQITVTLKDTSDNVVTGGKEVTLTQPSSDHSVISCDGTVESTCTTDTTTGVVVFSVTDKTVEDVTYTATDTTDSVPLTPSTPPSVDFEAPVVTPANCSISADPTSVASGGSSTITVTLDDQGAPPQPVANKAVTLTASGGSSVITPVSPTTNADGQATFTVSDTAAETVTYTAEDTTDSTEITGQSVQVTFGNLTVSPSDSTVTTNETVVSSAATTSGTPASTALVTVTLVASDGHSVVSGKTVTLSASSTKAVITPTSNPNISNGEGEATFTVGDTTAESVTFSAQDTTDNISITQTVTVDFEVPAASASRSSMSAIPTTLPADGVTPTTINVTILDQFGDPISGVVVTVTGNSTTTLVAPQTVSTNVPAGTTGASGTAVFYAYDTTAETVTYTATDTTDNVVIAQTVQVTFQATAPQANNSSLSASPADVPADGTTASTITVTLEDHNDNPVPGKTIALTAENGSSKINSVSPTTNAQGEATFSVTDTANEVVTYTATDTTDNLPLAGQAVTVTFGTPPPVTPSLADSTIVAQPTSVPADGTSTSTISVVLSDANGDALSGKTVALNPSGGNSSVTTVTGVTNSDGTATFTVSDRTVEDVTYTATDVTDGMPITGASVTVDFTTPPGGSASTSGSTTNTTSSSGGASVGTSTAIESGSTDSSSSGASDSSGASLAFTGAPNLLPWLLAMGGLLMVTGTLGRRRVKHAPAQSSNVEDR